MPIKCCVIVHHYYWVISRPRSNSSYDKANEKVHDNRWRGVHNFDWVVMSDMECQIGSKELIFLLKVYETETYLHFEGL